MVRVPLQAILRPPVAGPSVTTPGAPLGVSVPTSSTPLPPSGPTGSSQSTSSQVNIIFSLSQVSNYSQKSVNHQLNMSLFFRV